MASSRDIKRRIQSVVGIKQITRAMEMVATTKLRRFQARAQASRPYTNELEAIVARLAAVAPEGSPLLARAAAPGAEAKTSAKALQLGLLVITSDRGLCGAYNANVLSLVHRFLEERGLEKRGSGAVAGAAKPRIFVIGRKGYTYFSKRGYDVAHYFSEPALEKQTQRGTRIIARQLADEFLKGEIAELQVFSTRFESMMSFPAARTSLLPLAAPVSAPKAPDEKPTANVGDAILEPNAEFLLERLVPKYIVMKLWNLMLESITSEYASKRVSMKNATDAAEDMRNSLQATYNRVRQDTITKQLMEIVSGAEALR